MDYGVPIGEAEGSNSLAVKGLRDSSDGVAGLVLDALLLPGLAKPDKKALRAQLAIR